MRKFLLAIAALALTSCQVETDILDEAIDTLVEDIVRVDTITAVQKDPASGKGEAYIDFTFNDTTVRATYLEGSEYGPEDFGEGAEVGATFTLEASSLVPAKSVTVKYFLNAAGQPTASRVTFTDGTNILGLQAEVTGFEHVTTGIAVTVQGTAVVFADDFDVVEANSAGAKTIEVDFVLFISED